MLMTALDAKQRRAEAWAANDAAKLEHLPSFDEFRHPMHVIVSEDVDILLAIVRELAFLSARGLAHTCAAHVAAHMLNMGAFPGWDLE